MASTATMENEDGVFELITELCNRTASKYTSQNRVPQKRLVSKMRSCAYEIILKKSSKEVQCTKGEPIIDLLSYYLTSHRNVKNVAEFKRSVELKKIISRIRQTDFRENKDHIYKVLKLLVALSDTIKEDYSPELFQKPFTFGLLDEMLPKPRREVFGSPQPYPYFPSHVFELPFSLKRHDHKLSSPRSQTYTEYTVESFDSRSFLPDHISHGVEIRSFMSPMSIPSLATTSTFPSPYSEGCLWNFPRLTAPRDLQIPVSDTCVHMCSNLELPQVSVPSTAEVKEVFRAKSHEESIDIWEIATQMDKDIPDDIWEVVSKMPPINERQLIATSSREMALWRRIYGDGLRDLSVISEKQFIRNIMYLIIGIETKTFPFSQESNCFYMKEDLVLEGVSKEHIRGYVTDLLLVGTYYRRLFKFAFNQSLEDHFHTNGLVYEGAREVVRRFLLQFRLKATEIYEECCKVSTEDLNCMPTLLQILYHMEPLKYEIETIVSIYKLMEHESKSTIPLGAELMSYLFNEISLVTHKKTAYTMFNSLFSICKVYFKFIERFIFEGELDDRFNEFFIRKDSAYVHTRSKRYWDKGFYMTQSVAVPEFLRPLAKFILLCGKSLRLLKHCNPSDPLVLLISSDHPTVKCCASFEELEQQQEVLDVYRTRCLFVSGEPVTFEQILLKREAERKAFTEMASLKQAETMEKIVAERKRLAQLIIAEKQHSLRVLEEAMAEAKAAKMKSKQRERHRSRLQQELEKASEEVDARLRDDERNKMMAYYSKLNQEVEKSKMHTEWKIKRLQLDQSRIQLLSTEERNLKREKLELEHKKNEEIMAMSIQSTNQKSDDELDTMQDSDSTSNYKSACTLADEAMDQVSDLPTTESESKPKSSTELLLAICKAAKSIFSSSKSEDSSVDNVQDLDAQGNVVAVDSENNSDNKDTKSSDVIGADLNDAYDNLQYLKGREEALKNKHKVMAHEFGQLDADNNQVKDPPLVTVSVVDEENNIPDALIPFLEAKRNKLKVLGGRFATASEEPLRTVSEPITDAQKEAIANRQKILGVEYNLPIGAAPKKDPANVAQEEAVRNRVKILGSADIKPSETTKREPPKRSNLTLNLKPYHEFSGGGSSTFTPGVVTPGEFMARLDLETPTTADIPLEGAMTSDAFTPHSEGNRLETAELVNADKPFLSSDGFDFTLMVDETVDTEGVGDVRTTPESSPSKIIAPIQKEKKKSYMNFLDGTYSLVDFDPFGVRGLRGFSRDHFTSKMDVGTSSSCYTHPALIMEEVRKKPYSNIFASHFGPEEDDEQKIICDNIATLTACLQRSVMLPLTYQLEVVNNSILTYFLVNLDMYEHLGSLKDYFFLMDGEFSNSICKNLFTRLVKTLNPQELLNFATLHNILDKALGSSISHVHKFSENLSFTITESPLSFQHSSPDVLQCLSLTYTVSWPLNIILSQEALLRYAKVFQFLIKMRRIFWVLGEDFESLKLAAKLSRKHSRKLIKSPHYISVQIYRHIMASLIRALDNYIVTTCILSSWREFENDLKKARTLDDLYECHVVYIKKVLFRCLLNNRSTPVMKLLNDIFTVILKFSRVLKAGEWQQKEEGGYFTHSSFTQLQELFHLFEKLAKYLHKVITKLMECGYQRHLAELLTMVNLNGYYDLNKTKEEQNTTAQSTG
ncbi:gamma-tubulin complex component 6 [Pectinophora gossypiella]|uniref:gamma-tubulin complex component 6 n=1 Tax=Pectinophora gossypiella TaxID=13191 RepID=UPI00214F5611|nr:gamma-tubulin complex component 6 [Pectinophora gossypiella]